MFSIRNICLLSLAAVGTLSVVGCQEKPAENPAALNDTPLIIDGAMQKRDWDRTSAVYANDHVTTNADRFPLQASDSTVDRWGWATETPIFLANSAIWPFTYITTRPGAWINYPSVTTPPTYTAVPPMEPIPSYGLEQDARRGSIAIAASNNK